MLRYFGLLPVVPLVRIHFVLFLLPFPALLLSFLLPFLIGVSISPSISAHFSLDPLHLLPSNTSKCSELEEELKTVTNNLKSLEAQAEKVGSLPLCSDPGMLSKPQIPPRAIQENEWKEPGEPFTAALGSLDTVSGL